MLLPQKGPAGACDAMGKTAAAAQAKLPKPEEGTTSASVETAAWRTADGLNSIMRGRGHGPAEVRAFAPVLAGVALQSLRAVHPPFVVQREQSSAPETLFGTSPLPFLLLPPVRAA